LIRTCYCSYCVVKGAAQLQNTLPGVIVGHDFNYAVGVTLNNHKSLKVIVLPTIMRIKFEISPKNNEELELIRRIIEELYNQKVLEKR